MGSAGVEVAAVISLKYLQLICAQCSLPLPHCALSAPSLIVSEYVHVCMCVCVCAIYMREEGKGRQPRSQPQRCCPNLVAVVAFAALVFLFFSFLYFFWFVSSLLCACENISAMRSSKLIFSGFFLFLFSVICAMC